jgi:hypothetical protein
VLGRVQPGMDVLGMKGSIEDLYLLVEDTTQTSGGSSSEISISLLKTRLRRAEEVRVRGVRLSVLIWLDMLLLQSSTQ